MITELESIATDMSWEFGHGEKSWLNLKADEQTFPVVYVDQPLKFTIELPPFGGMIENYPGITLFFLKKSEMDWTPVQHDVVVSQCKLAAAAFILRMRAHASFDTVGNGDAIEVKNLFDVNASGVMVTVAVKTNSIPVCI